MPAILPGYEYDIFISYRQNDNKRDGWVTNFVAALKDELEATLKNPVSIYFDANPHDGLLETHQVNATLEKKLKCLIFIPIISQTYCDTTSFAWEHEFIPFIKIANDDELGMNITLANGNVASRMLPIKIHDLDAQDQSTLEKELAGPLRSIDFIYKEPGVNRSLKPNDERSLNLAKTDYHNQINKVANALKEIGTGVLRKANHEGDKASEKVITAMPETIKLRKNRISLKMILGLLFLPLIVAAAYYLYMNYAHQVKPPADLEKSIAVLPFVDMSPNKDQQYFSDGISEELINALVKIPNLKVAGRTSSFSYREINKNLKLIGDELDVATLLEGSIRKSGNQLRITAQLINASDGFNLWSETFNIEFTDIFSVQDQITEAIMLELNVRLGENEKPPPKSSTNQEAYTTYLRARQELAKRREHIVVAVNLFKETISLDPNFAPAYSGLGKSLSIFTTSGREDIDKIYREAKDAANNALALEPDNAEAYLVLGALAVYHEWDWQAAERNLLKAVALNPNDGEMYNFLGDYYLVTLNEKLAIEMESEAVELDPLLPINHANLAFAYYTFEHYEESLKINFEGFVIRGAYVALQVINYIALNRIDEAMSVYAEFKERGGKEILGVSSMVIDIAIANNDTDLAIKEIQKIPEFLDVLRAQYYLDLKMWDEAAELLEKAYINRNGGLVYYSNIKLPEDYPDHPALQKAFDKPELNALFEIRRKNLRNNESSK